METKKQISHFGELEVLNEFYQKKKISIFVQY